MKDVRPFFVPRAGAIGAGPWMIEIDGEWEPVEEHLRDWDQSTTLRLVGAPTIEQFGQQSTGLTLTVPPERAGGAVVLTRRLVLLQGRLPAAGEAHRAGSVL